MIYYTIHQLLRVLPGFCKMEDLQLNCITFLFGSILYFILYGYFLNNSQSVLAKAVHGFGIYFWLVDAITMAILYRFHYGRSILAEVVDDDPEKWIWNDTTNKYERSDLEKRKNYYKNKVDEINQTSDVVDRVVQQAHQFQTSLEDLKEYEEKLEEKEEKLDKIDQLEKEVKELDTMVRYAPGGTIFKEELDKMMQLGIVHDSEEE